MAGEDRTASHLVAFLRDLEREPYRYHFYQVLRRLDCLAAGKPRLGESASPRDDVVRLGQEPSLAFAPATLAAVRRGTEGRPDRVLVHFLGLLGPNGPLPLHLTEYVRDRLRNADDPTLARFLDVFHHRLLCLFYRAWAAAQPAVHLDRPASDRFADYIGSFLGIGEPAVQGHDAVPDWVKLYYAGHLSCGTRHARGLAAIVQDFFQLPGRVEEFVARWIDLPRDSLLRVGESPQSGTLGTTAVVGDRVWDCVQTFRIVLGPLTFDEFRRFLPGRESLLRLEDLVRNYVGDEFAWQLQLVLRKDAIPPSELGQTGQLGWTTWLASEQRGEDANDMILEPRLRVA